jgi:DNA-binding protein H-NS
MDIMATKSKSYQNILKQIEALKAEAEKVRRDEIGGVIARIREAIDHYGLTAADLGLTVKAKPGPKASAAPKRKKRKGAAAKPAGEVKYSNGAGGTWGGRGKRPTWLRDALAAGKQLGDFAVK